MHPRTLACRRQLPEASGGSRCCACGLEASKVGAFGIVIYLPQIIFLGTTKSLYLRQGDAIAGRGEKERICDVLLEVPKPLSLF